jgi:hypothetical protein
MITLDLPRRLARSAARAGGLLALAVVAACGGGGGGGGGETPPVPPNVTAAGGTVSSADGRARLQVPAGAATTPATVTLATVANPSLPPDADIVPGGVVELGGNGGALAVPAEIAIEAGQAFPLAGAGRGFLPADAASRSARLDDQRKGILSWLTDTEFCDIDGDGDVDEGDVLSIALGAECYQPPKLVRLTPQTVAVLDRCNPPLNLTARCRISSLAAAQLALQMDLKAPTVAIESFDGRVHPDAITIAGNYNLRVAASDNKGVVKVGFYRWNPANNNLLMQPIGQDTSAPYEVSLPITAAHNGEWYLVARAFDAWGNIGTRALRLRVEIDTTAPTVSLAATSTTVTVGQSASFTATASDNLGAPLVQLLRNGVIVAFDASAPYTFQAGPFTAADIGSQQFEARAIDTSNNVTVSTPVTIQVVAAPDTQPPAVTLQASASSAQVGQAVTLNASASDDVGVTKVEFLRNGVKVAEDLASPYAYAPPAFTAGDVGTVVYAARAFDAAGNQATSADVTVTVSAAPGSEVYVSPSGADTNAGTAAAPLRTLAKAFQTVGAGGTVWLHNGVFTATGEGLQGPEVATGRTLPAGAALKAVNDGGATLGFTLQVPAGGSLVGLVFDASSQGRVLAGGGTVVVSRPAWVKLGLTTLSHGIVASGTARVLVDPKGNPQHNYAGSGLTGFASAADSSELVVDGGRIDGTTGQAGGFALDGAARLTLKALTITNTSGAWVGGGAVVDVAGTANIVLLDGVTIDLANAAAACIVADRQVAGPTPAVDITLVNATLTRCAGGGVQLREGTPKLTVTASAITNNGRHAIEAGQIGFDSGVVYAQPQIVASGLVATGNAQGGILMNMGGSLSIDGGQVTTVNTALQLLGAKPYALRLRSVVVDGGIFGLRLEGDGSAGFDLGTLASPGGNTVRGASTGLRLTTAAGVTVQAVGNTWIANTQGADASGKYSPASSVCGNSNPCDVTTGSGLNYTFAGAGAGAKLRLAQQ